MKPVFVTKDEMHIAGIGIRTSNRKGTEAIGELWQRFYREGILDRIIGRLHENIVYGVYSRYESDENGEYDLLIGSEIQNGSDVPQGITLLTIPAATYAVFTSRRGPVAEVVPEVWGQIWEWSRNSGYKRTFVADFERYDMRSSGPDDVQVELYIACQPD